MLNLYVSVCLCCSMLIYYLQAIARSLKFTNNQLRLQLQTVSFIWLHFLRHTFFFLHWIGRQIQLSTKINCKSAHDSQRHGGNYHPDMKADRNGTALHLFCYGISWHNYKVKPRPRKYPGQCLLSPHARNLFLEVVQTHTQWTKQKWKSSILCDMSMFKNHWILIMTKVHKIICGSYPIYMPSVLPCT